MTVKQKKFADEYIISGNATESATKAGYSKKTATETGYENLRKPHIKSYIDERMQKLEDKQIAKQEEVLKYLTSLMRGEKREEVLKGIGMGEQVIVPIDVSAKDRIKAAELIGKRYGMWTDKVDVTGSVIIFEGEDDLED